MSSARWARLSGDFDCGLRRGAWYRTLRRTLTDALLEVHGDERVVPIELLEIVDERPDRWTVVAQASNARVIPNRWSRGYAVCPNCTFRQLPIGRPTRLRCDECGHVYDVAWDELYPRLG
jgi:rubredoxin